MTKIKLLSALLLSVALALPSRSWAAAAPSAFEARCDELSQPAPQQTESQRLWKLFDVYWRYQMTEYPEWATYAGYPGSNDRWTDNSFDAIARRKREAAAPLKALETIDRSKLSADDKLNYDLFKRVNEEGVESDRFPDELLPITQLGGVQQDLAQTLAIAPRTTVKDYEDILARLNAAPAAVDQAIALMTEGLKRGVTMPKVALRDVPGQIEAQAVTDPAASPLFKPFERFPASIPAGEQRRLRAAALRAVSTKVAPAFKRLGEFFVKTYLPGCRESVAWTDLPDGKAWYAFKARRHTTTDMTPEQIHALGLAEVKRIRAEMESVMRGTGFKGSFQEFCVFLRSDPRFFYASAQDLLDGYRVIAKTIDPELIRLFRKLPRLPYGVTPVPSYAEKSQTTAYYEQGSLEAGRPGQFFANTYALNTRPKWEMEALTLHEAVPGHHLQISLQQELERLPDFRKQGEFTAYTEGWGLYAESLGGEIGLYKDPYSRFGALTYEMWRAVRLVADTGLHSFGWSRQQAIDFFKENSSKSDHDIAVEVDRYIVWPGQALAYKIGQLKIRALRDLAQRELGDRFDARAFHDVVLAQGSVPLSVLEDQVKLWIAQVEAASQARK